MQKKISPGGGGKGEGGFKKNNLHNFGKLLVVWRHFFSKKNIFRPTWAGCVENFSFTQVVFGVCLWGANFFLKKINNFRLTMQDTDKFFLLASGVRPQKKGLICFFRPGGGGQVIFPTFFFCPWEVTWQFFLSTKARWDGMDFPSPKVVGAKFFFSKKKVFLSRTWSKKNFFFPIG